MKALAALVAGLVAGWKARRWAAESVAFLDAFERECRR